MHTSQHLIEQYLDVVNAALTAHGDHFPWKQIIAKGERDWAGKQIGLGINDGGTVTEVHTLTFAGGRFAYGAPGKLDTAYTWEADRSFLEKVASNPQEYADSPMKINWDWMLSSLGIGNEASAGA